MKALCVCVFECECPRPCSQQLPCLGKDAHALARRSGCASARMPTPSNSQQQPCLDMGAHALNHRNGCASARVPTPSLAGAAVPRQECPRPQSPERLCLGKDTHALARNSSCTSARTSTPSLAAVSVKAAAGHLDIQSPAPYKGLGASCTSEWVQAQLHPRV